MTLTGQSITSWVLDTFAPWKTPDNSSESGSEAPDSVSDVESYFDVLEGTFVATNASSTPSTASEVSPVNPWKARCDES